MMEKELEILEAFLAVEKLERRKSAGCKLISELKVLKQAADLNRRNCLIAKTTGTSVSAVGTALTVTGIILAPVTFGLSAILSGIGIGAGVLGTAVSVGTTITDKGFIRKKDKIELCKQCELYQSVRKEWLDRLDDSQHLKLVLHDSVDTTTPDMSDWTFPEEIYVEDWLNANVRSFIDKEVQIDEIQRGDHIYRHKSGSRMVYHHGIFLGEVDGTQVVVEFGAMDKILPMKMSIVQFLNAGGTLYKRDYRGFDLPVNDTLTLAQTILNEQNWEKYHWFGNNCEHFATFLKLKTLWSSQTSGARKMGMEILNGVGRTPVAVKVGVEVTESVARISATWAGVGSRAIGTLGKATVGLAPVMTAFDIGMLIKDFTTKQGNIERLTTGLEFAEQELLESDRAIEQLKKYLRSRQKDIGDLDGTVTLDLVVKNTEKSIARRAIKLFIEITEQVSNDGMASVENGIEIGRLIIGHLEEVLKSSYHSDFKRLAVIECFDIIYRVYDQKCRQLLKPLIEKVYRNLEPLDLKYEYAVFLSEGDSTRTSLRKLYSTVKAFAALAFQMNSPSDLCIQGSFHQWFQPSLITEWLDIAYYEARTCIQIAVQQDALVPVHDSDKHTSSAVETVEFLLKIQKFWNELAWPDTAGSGSSSFIAKLIHDFCNGTIYYAEQICITVGLEKSTEDDKYEISNQLCFAINNIEWVGQELKPIIEKLGLPDIFEDEENGPCTSANSEMTVWAAIEHTNSNTNNAITKVMDSVACKIRLEIIISILEGLKPKCGEDGVELLEDYLNKNLSILHQQLTPSNFDKILPILWENASLAFREIITRNIDKRRPTDVFKRIHNMLQSVKNSFHPDPSSLSNLNTKVITEVEDILELYSAPTADLIMKYYQERYQVQEATDPKTSELGSLTISANYSNQTQMLQIEILNARNLKPLHSSGECSPYVKLKLVPDVPDKNRRRAFKTKSKKRTLFPLFEETFCISLRPDEMTSGRMLVFSVKAQRNDYLGECYLPLGMGSGPFTGETTKVEDQPQIYLSLTLTKEPNVILQSLGNRSWDRSPQNPVDFVERERRKMSSF